MYWPTEMRDAPRFPEPLPTSVRTQSLSRSQQAPKWQQFVPRISWKQNFLPRYFLADFLQKRKKSPFLAEGITCPQKSLSLGSAEDLPHPTIPSVPAPADSRSLAKLLPGIRAAGKSCLPSCSTGHALCPPQRGRRHQLINVS